MRRRPRWVWLLATLLTVSAAGCTKRELRPKKPDDPLLTTKTPVKAHFQDASNARAEPSAPAMPTGVWAASPGTPPASPARLGAPEPASVAAPATLAWSTDKPPVSPAAAARTGAGDLYARSADRRWLQGVLERAPHEGWLLRYEAISRDGQGGKVVLEGHPRLDLLQAGDVIRVEGTLAEDKGAPAPSDWLPYPRYRVSTVRVIQRRE